MFSLSVAYPDENEQNHYSNNLVLTWEHKGIHGFASPLSLLLGTNVSVPELHPWTCSALKGCCGESRSVGAGSGLLQGAFPLFPQCSLPWVHPLSPVMLGSRDGDSHGTMPLIHDASGV